MSESYVSDFLDDVALELSVIEKVAPGVMNAPSPVESVYNPSDDSMLIGITAHSVLGRSLSDAVEELGIRPIAFGGAWKVLDRLLEYSLTAAGVAPSNGHRWTIAEKVRHARAGVGKASPLSDDSDLWQRVFATYVATEQVRHSLIHRRATIGPQGEVTGVDPSGNALPAVTKDEQVYFMRVVQRSVKYLQQTSITPRDRAVLISELGQLANVTGLSPTGTHVLLSPPIPVRVPVQDGQTLDLTRIKTRIRDSAPDASGFDVRFDVGDEAHEVPLENIPDGSVRFSSSAAWLKAD